MSGLARLYVWSIVFEPLLFFQLFSQAVVGIGGNLSRMLQLLVVAGLLARLALATGSRAGSIRFVRLASPRYANYLTYFVLAVAAGVLGAISGAYAFAGVAATNSSSVAAGFLNSASIRPVFEYVIAAYYFIYFAILPQYFLTSQRSISYFFRTFRAMFIVVLVTGAVGLVLAAAGTDLLPRALTEQTYVGARFHGVAGEPRDAFVYLFFALAVLHLQAFYRAQRLNRWWIAVAATAAMLTQSLSGMIGLAIFVGLYGLYALPSMGVKRVSQLLGVSTLVVVLGYATVVNSPRMMLYFEAASGMWSVLESGVALPPVMAQQVSNLFPLYDLFVKVRNFEWLPVLMGSGLGSASAVNTYYVDAIAEVSNPQSQLVRTLYESGIIGTIFLTTAFTRPVKHVTRRLSAKQRNEFLVLTLLLIGSFFAHRSSTVFIYVGIVIAVFRYRDRGGATPTSGRSSVRGPGPDMVPVG